MKLTLSFADELIRRVEAFGERMGMPRAEAFRYLVASGLSVELWRGAAIDSAAAQMQMVELSKQLPEEVGEAAALTLEKMAKDTGRSRARTHACSNTRVSRPKMAGTGKSGTKKGAEVREIGGAES